jgi:hypothetical protein
MDNFTSILTCANTNLAPVTNPIFSGNVGVDTASPGAFLDIKPMAPGNNALLDVSSVFNTASSINTAFIHTDATFLSGTNTGTFTGSALEVTTFPNNVSGNIGDTFRVGTSDSAGNSFSPFFTIKAATGYVGVGTDSPSYTFYVNGSSGGSQGWTTMSDARMKTDITEIANPLDIVTQLRGVRFKWRPADRRGVGEALKLPLDESQIGFVAQEVAAVVPEAVVVPAAGSKVPYGVRDSSIIPILVEAMKAQQAEIKALQAEVAALKLRN